MCRLATAALLAVLSAQAQVAEARIDHAGLSGQIQQKTRDSHFPTCSRTEEYVGIDGWHASFQFPKVDGITASAQSQDADCGARSYYLESVPGHPGIMHGSGPMWSFGMPPWENVRRSVRYQENTYDLVGVTIADARGELPNGNLWRFLDGACVASGPHQ